VSLRDAVLGAWQLESFVARDVESGHDRRPLGTDPRGLITYTPDGHMSAQLARADMSEYVAYGGGFAVDEDRATVRHDVTMATMPDLLTAPQFRAVELDGDRLVLSVTTTDEHGNATASTLVWRRAQSTVAR
jgi:hypothetical protein